MSDSVRKEGQLFDIEHVAGCLRAERARRKMNLCELSEASGIPVTTLQTYEQGKNVMSLENAWAIADVFGMDMDDLFGRRRSA